MQNTAGGMCLLILAGMMNASFSLPMKFIRSWAWENTWLLWSIFALLVLPGALAFATIPSFAAILQTSGSVVLLVALCGAAWGVAQVLFGLALDKIGIALTFSIVLGLSAAMGSLIPLIRLHSDRLFTRGGLMSLTGIALVLVGVAASAVAGTIRDRGKQTGDKKERGRRSRIADGDRERCLRFHDECGISPTEPHSHPRLQPTARIHSGSPTPIWVPLLAGRRVA